MPSRKTSPINKHMNARDKYLQKPDNQKQALVKNVLDTARKYAPGAESAMPYGVPGLKYKGKNLIAAAAHKKHLGIYPFSPVIVKKVSQKFSIADTDEGTIRFSYPNPPPENLIKYLVELRLKELLK